MKQVNSYHFDYKPFEKDILQIFSDLSKANELDTTKYKKILHRKIQGFDGVLSKNQLLQAYKGILKNNPAKLLNDPKLFEKIQMKPMRTQSGVTPVTVLTKPFPCPGKCIFCPNDVRMPKSYLPNEPGAQRARRNNFDPYLQVYDRLRAFENIGHSVSKIELIILGGTWSFYPETYQRWFVKRCFEAMNDFGEGLDKTHETNYDGLDDEKLAQLDAISQVIEGAKLGEVNYNQLIAKINADYNRKNRHIEQAEWEVLEAEHARNVNNNCRCVGLVIETRPDNISEAEVLRIRRLGCTKVQIGIQSLQDNVLELNHRGHDVMATSKAFELLRLAGFKIHGHWMANLYGSNPEPDKQDYKELFDNPHFKPDELKIYPCSLLDTAELIDYYKKGLWKPYSQDELLDVLVYAISNTPEYCRLTRVIRDIPSTDIVVGNKNTNLRENAETIADQKNLLRADIRSREIKNFKVNKSDLIMKQTSYQTSVSREIFLQFVTSENKIAGFLRLSIPKFLKENNRKHQFCKELDGCAMIREVHVYGNVVNVGANEQGKTQHLGLGTELINQAKAICKKENIQKLAVISAIGTRDYYTKRGFELDKLYQVCELC